MLRGSNRPVLWSGGFSMPCVTHLGLHQGPAGLRAADSTAAAALRGKARRRAFVHVVLGFSGRDRFREHAQGKSKSKQGLRGALLCCTGLATAERGGGTPASGVPAPRVCYGLQKLAQKDTEVGVVLTEA